jgi:UDP:flavonoid glycosyltransferase YjiC (YdhE family)
MRVLITCVPGYGHLHPLLPLANALVDASHEVAIATGPDMRPRAETAGFTTFPAGVGMSETWQRLVRRYPDQVFNRLAPDEIMQWYLPHLFGEIVAPAMLEDLVPLVRGWRPNVVVHDTFDFAAPVAAAMSGVPSVSHTLGIRFEGELLDLIAAAVAPLWRQHGLAADATAGLYRHLCLDIMPPALQAEEPARCPDVIRGLRPVGSPPIGEERLPNWMTGRRRQRGPLVYMTLGTETNSDVSMFRSVLDGLEDLDVDVLVTVGANRDPSCVGSVPGNAHIERYVPQSLLLPRCTVVICHGGAGTTLGALAHGVPLLVVPQGADQYIIGERVASSGAGLRLVPWEVNADSVRRCVLDLLHGTEYRRAARRVQSEIAAMPAPDETVPVIEHIGERVGAFLA